ncbi:hypothetical protein ABW20_dc0108228 [Dactylellina cionopaga]|nr:hypothetical protein ABW20_dc0108228 [Dactylellina cionopaga]
MYLPKLHLPIPNQYIFRQVIFQASEYIPRCHLTPPPLSSKIPDLFNHRSETSNIRYNQVKQDQLLIMFNNGKPQTSPSTTICTQIKTLMIDCWASMDQHTQNIPLAQGFTGLHQGILDGTVRILPKQPFENRSPQNPYDNRPAGPDEEPQYPWEGNAAFQEELLDQNQGNDSGDDDEAGIENDQARNGHAPIEEVNEVEPRAEISSLYTKEDLTGGHLPLRT